MTHFNEGDTQESEADFQEGLSARAVVLKRRHLEARATLTCEERIDDHLQRTWAAIASNTITCEASCPITTHIVVLSWKSPAARLEYDIDDYGNFTQIRYRFDGLAGLSQSPRGTNHNGMVWGDVEGTLRGTVQVLHGGNYDLAEQLYHELGLGE